jgi:hypothetical protein
MNLIDGIILGLIGLSAVIIIIRLWKSRGQCASGCSSCEKSSLCQLDLYKEYQQAKSTSTETSSPKSSSKK